ncbi:hypothetical protein C8R45DRAFT_1038884 [Mycena sanguinolenta]|nr:hypothetical protein C8R45DRAFT_1038884 [Mycena sanguinolenta]
MVLTRRAARAQNSIVRWMPNEILADIMSQSSKSDLLALCRTSRLLRNIATRLLYRIVSLSIPEQIMAFLRTMESIEPRKRLPGHVREFRIADIRGSESLSKRTVKSLASVLFQFHRLECLDLLLNDTIEFTDILDYARFQNLATFRYTLQTQNPTSLSSFLNRHPTVTNLTLHATVGPLQRLDAIHLPHLTVYDGPSLFVPLFDDTSLRSVTEVSLTIYALDDDVDTALMRLGPMTALHALSAVVMGVDIEISAFLTSVARHIPRTEILIFRAHNPAPFSREATLKIAGSLAELSHLVVIGFSVDDRTEHDDRETVALWCEACKSLSTIILHREVWDCKDGHWESTPLSTPPA